MSTTTAIASATVEQYMLLYITGGTARPAQIGDRVNGIAPYRRLAGQSVAAESLAVGERYFGLLSEACVVDDELKIDAPGKLSPNGSGETVGRARQSGSAGRTVEFVYEPAYRTDGNPSGNVSTTGPLSITDSVTGRENGDRHTVTTGVMIGAEFTIQSNTWVYVAQTTPTIAADSTSPANWPISDADIATIVAKMSSGQSYRFNVEDTVQKKYGTVELRQNGIMRFQLLSATPLTSSPGGLNPAEVIDGTALGAAKTLDCQNGKQLLFRVTGAMPQETTFTIANLPDQEVAIVVIESAQGIAPPVFSGVSKLNADPLYNTRTVVTIMNTSGTLNMIANAQQS